MESVLISIMLQVVQHFIKNPQHAETFKTQLMDVRNAINGLFPGE